MTCKEAAEKLGLSESSVRRLILQGRLASHKVGPVHWIDRKEVSRLQRERKRHPPRRGNPNW